MVRAGQSSEKSFVLTVFAHSSKTKFEILTGLTLLEILRSTTLNLLIFLEISTEIWEKLILMIF